MAKKIEKFSAFKLFYDEFIYKRDFNVGGISRNLDIIKDELFKVRKTPKYDTKEYMLVLDRANSRIKLQLNEIYEINQNIYEFYYLLYKAKTNLDNNQVKDMPFVISCSFYDDYRLDDKTAEELENSSFVIPKYSSLEKKQIRDEAEGKPKLLFLLDLIRNSDEFYRYSLEFEYIDTLLVDYRPSKISSREYFDRVRDRINIENHIYVRLLNKIQYSKLAELIDEMFVIVYRKKFTYSIEEFDKLLLDYFDKLFSDKEEDNAIIKKYLTHNDISYESYKLLLDDYTKEKSTFKKLYDDSKFEPIVVYDDSDISKFKASLANMYYDRRYINEFTKYKTPSDYVSRAIEIYNLANDLDDQLFEKLIFDAGHSKKLGRYADVNSALLSKIYFLYNPFDLLNRYEKARKDFELKVSKMDEDFLKEYQVELNDLKVSRDYHGPIPSKEFVMVKLIEKQKDFLFEHCVTDLKNTNSSGTYDTRNYDLDIMASGLSPDDLVDVYEKMKYRINTFDFDSLTFLDKTSKEDDYTKSELLKELQKFIAENILIYLKFGSLTEEQRNNRLKDICFTYLNEKCLFITGSNKKKKENIVFNDVLDKFNKKSKWRSIYNKYGIK
jgi:hypothetical protein